MGVLVCYDDYSYDVITAHHLERLLDSGRVTGYDNSGNWRKQEEPDQEIILLTELAHDPSERHLLK